jgi:hypothetical protein
VRFGVYSVASLVSLYGCADTGTKPFIGVSNDRGVISCRSSNCPGGSGAQFYDVGGGGAFLPLQESGLSLSDNTISDSSTTKHGLCLKAVAPSSGLLNVVGIGNGESGFSNKGITGVAVADATGAGDVVAQLNALLASLRTVLLIKT